jgi:hypothetical protein
MACETQLQRVSLSNLLELYDGRIRAVEALVLYSHERALWCLLTHTQDALLPFFQKDFDRHWFHKAFRQIDVTDSGDLDMAIWHLLGKSEILWKLFDDLENNRIPE